MIVYLGNNFGFLYPAIQLDSGTTQSVQVSNQEILQINLTIAYLSTGALFFCVIFCRSKPKSPPSFTSVKIFHLIFRYRIKKASSNPLGPSSSAVGSLWI
jgi:hypothetical protein